MPGRKTVAIRILPLLLAGCAGYPTKPTGVTSAGAMLHAQVSCAARRADNPCTAWFQFWEDGSGTLNETGHVTANVNPGGFFDFAEPVSGLLPATLYHYEVCGYGDQNIAPPGYCMSGGNRPGTRPDGPFQASPLNAALPAAKDLRSPVFGGDGYLYVFASDHAKNAIYVARVKANAANWSDGGNFRWWTGSVWSTDSSKATTIIPGGSPGGMHVADYSHTTSMRYVLVTQTDRRTGAFRTFMADSPKGPWTSGPAGALPDNCRGGQFGCYAIIGHPELSTTTQFVYSWFSPDDRGGLGHVRVGAIDW